MTLNMDHPPTANLIGIALGVTVAIVVIVVTIAVVCWVMRKRGEITFPFLYNVDVQLRIQVFNIWGKKVQKYHKRKKKKSAPQMTLLVIDGN